MTQKTCRQYTILDSFNDAIEGFLFVIKTQRNMRIHFLLTLFVVLLGIKLDFTRTEMILLCITAGLVLITEMFNTSMEIVLDYIEASHSHWVRIVKDIAAGSVLIASLNAVGVGYLLFFRGSFFGLFSGLMRNVNISDWHISFLALLLVVVAVIVLKVITRSGKPLLGGMPSGHAAVAFSAWTLIALYTRNPLIVFTVFILAFLVAQSRISRKCHTIPEVVIGAVIGVLLTITVYKLFGK